MRFNKGEILKKLGTVVKVGATIGSIFTSGGTATAAANAEGSLLQAGIDKGVDSLVEGATASIDIVDLVKKHSATKDDVELQELITNPLPKLAQAFIQTLIQKSQQQPILLFVDTYEKAASEFDTFFCRFLLSHRELKQAAVRIVMVGRYSLNNSRYQRMFQQSEIDKSERQLDKFNQEETKVYLNEIGITKPGDINKFWKATKGYPYYLNLIREQQENGKEIRLSRGGKDMVDLLLDGFSDTEKKVIRLVAYCRWFDHRVIEYLIEQNNIEQDPEHSWFDWLINRDFTVEESYYRFDDVARDVIRQAEHNYDKRNFAQIHQQLSNYFQQLADETIDPDELVDEKYEDPDWREYTVEATYHALYADKKQGQLKLLTHFFEGAYLKDPQVAIESFTAVMSETTTDELRLLPGNSKNFLQSITYAIMYGWMFIRINLERYEISLKSDNNTEYLEAVKRFNTDIESALSKCLKEIENLSGLAKCFGLIGRYIRSKHLDRDLALLNQVQREIDELGIKRYERLGSLTYIFRGNVLSDLGKYEEALSDLNQAIELNPDDSNAWNNRGVILGNLCRYEKALYDLNQAIELNPDNYLAWRNRGHALDSLDRYEKALSDLNQAIKLNSDDSSAWNIRGVILGNLCRYEEALSDFNQAIELNFDNSNAWLNRANVLNKLNR